MIKDVNLNYNFCLVGAATDVGKVRQANEDHMAVFETATMKVFVVCDGMGGHVGGQVASQTATAAIQDFLKNCSSSIDPRDAIHDAIITANEAILNRARQQPELAGMGSTCVLLAVTIDGRVYYGHVGDSRIYIVANHRITQLTKDHSYVQTLVDAGLITKEQAEYHPRKNEITNALGFENMQSPTVHHTPIEPESGNCFLLCSDGLTGMVSDEQINRVVSKLRIPIQQRAERLVEMANENGGVDNITVELVEFTVGTKDVGGSCKKFGNWKKMLLYIAPLLVVLGGLAWFLATKERSGTGLQSLVPRDSVIVLEDPIEYRTSSWIPLGVFVKSAEVDSVFTEYLEVKGIDKNGSSVSFQWKEKELKKDSIILLCPADTITYRITIPIKYQLGEISATPTINPTTPDSKSNGKNASNQTVAPNEITIENIILADNQVKVNLSEHHRNLKGKEWRENKSLSCSLKTFKASITSKGVVTITKLSEGELPKDGIMIECSTTEGYVYQITIKFKEGSKDDGNASEKAQEKGDKIGGESSSSESGNEKETEAER